MEHEGDGEPIVISGIGKINKGLVKGLEDL